MSMKIYNGWMMPPLTLTELHKKVLETKVKVMETVHEKIRDLYGDADNFKKHWMNIQERSWDVERTKSRDPLADFAVEIVFFPSKDCLLYMVFTEHDIFTNKIRDELGARYYGYWNNTDPEEGVSEELWEKRGKDWNEALGGDGYTPPSQCGFSFVFNDYTIPRAEEVWPSSK